MHLDFNSSKFFETFSAPNCCFALTAFKPIYLSKFDAFAMAKWCMFVEEAWIIIMGLYYIARYKFALFVLSPKLSNFWCNSFEAENSKSNLDVIDSLRCFCLYWMSIPHYIDVKSQTWCKELVESSICLNQLSCKGWILTNVCMNRYTAVVYFLDKRLAVFALCIFIMKLPILQPKWAFPTFVWLRLRLRLRQVQSYTSLMTNGH